LGQHKAESTLLERRVVIPNRDCHLAIEGAQQIIVEKQNVDVFTAPNLSRVIERLAGDRYVVYGVVTEICVLFAARGLLKTGKPVTVVTDAIETLKSEDSARALHEIRNSGGAVARLAEIAA
jgi:nicotinamidase/pyrazinamidase